MKMDDFILIEAEKLSVNDEFMQWGPQTSAERETKKLIIHVITSGVKNFYRPKYDPSFTVDKKNICFVPGEMPATGKSYEWWEETAKKYNLERNSRLGTILEYGAFLGVLIKKLVEEGRTVEWAWNAVCNDSKELGHYQNSENARWAFFERTGSREVCGYFDLGNTYKILAEDVTADAVWVAGGCFIQDSTYYPIADLDLTTDRTNGFTYSVGWIVLEK